MCAALPLFKSRDRIEIMHHTRLQTRAIETMQHTRCQTRARQSTRVRYQCVKLSLLLGMFAQMDHSCSATRSISRDPGPNAALRGIRESHYLLELRGGGKQAKPPMVAASSSMFETLQRLRQDGRLEQRKASGKGHTDAISLFHELDAPASSFPQNNETDVAIQENITQDAAAVSPIDVARNENTGQDALDAMLDAEEENSSADNVQEVQAESVSEAETVSSLVTDPTQPRPCAQGNVHPDRLQNIHPDRLQNIRTGAESAGTHILAADPGQMQAEAAHQNGSSSGMQKQASASLATTFRRASEGASKDEDDSDEWEKFDTDKVMSGEQKLPPGLEKEIVRALCKQTLYVRNLPKMMTDEECVELFGKFGSLMDLRLGERRSTAGSAYVVYQTAEEATEALRELTGLRVKDRYLVAQLHRPERARFVQDEKREELKRIEREIFSSPAPSAGPDARLPDPARPRAAQAAPPTRPRAHPPLRDGNRTPLVSGARTPLLHPGQQTPLFPGGQTPLRPAAGATPAPSARAPSYPHLGFGDQGK